MQDLIRMFPQDIKVLKIQNFTDRRGSLSIVFESDEPQVIALKKSQSKKYVFRGMHFQRDPFPQKKVIQVLSGTIIDIVINMDINSVDYGRVFERIIKAEDGELFYIPGYYAHGFLALTDVEFQYITLGKYSYESEMSISLPSNYFESKGLSSTEFILSDKDAAAISYENYFSKV